METPLGLAVEAAKTCRNQRVWVGQVKSRAGITSFIIQWTSFLTDEEIFEECVYLTYPTKTPFFASL